MKLENPHNSESADIGGWADNVCKSVSSLSTYTREKIVDIYLLALDVSLIDRRWGMNDVRIWGGIYDNSPKGHEIQERHSDWRVFTENLAANS